MVSIFKAFKAANNPKKWEEAFKNADHQKIGEYLMETSSMELGKRGVDYLIKEFPRHAYNFAASKTECNLPELKTLAKKGFQALADDPAALDEAIGKNDYWLVFELVRGTSSKELGERGLAYLIEQPQKGRHMVDLIARGGWSDDRSLPVNLPVIQESAKTVLRAWVDDEKNLFELILTLKENLDEVKTIVELTGSRHVGEHALVYILGRDPETVKHIANGRCECNLPELREFAKELIELWADDPKTLVRIMNDEYRCRIGYTYIFSAEKYKCSLIRDVVLTTSDIEVGIVGLSLLLGISDGEVDNVAMEVVHPNLPELRGVAIEMRKGFRNNFCAMELLERCNRNRALFLDEMRNKKPFFSYH